MAIQMHDRVSTGRALVLICSSIANN